MKTTVEMNEKISTLLQAQERMRVARETAMPDEASAMRAMYEAYTRLKDLGWKQAIYCPKDGTRVMYFECGCLVPAPGAYHGEWPTGGWFIEADGDLWPSHPALFRLLKDGE